MLLQAVTPVFVSCAFVCHRGKCAGALRCLQVWTCLETCTVHVLQSMVPTQGSHSAACEAPRPAVTCRLPSLEE